MISWEEANQITRKTIDKARKKERQPEVEEYAKEIGISESMGKATWQYAEWSAAAELRLLSAKGVRVKWMTNKQIEKYCGRGLPWEVRQKPVCESKDQDFIEEQAWNAKADGAFTGDMLGMIAEILAQMMQRRSNGHKLGTQDKEFLKKILKEEDGK